jgi:hypothetical protein
LVVEVVELERHAGRPAVLADLAALSRTASWNRAVRREAVFE